MIPFLYCFSLKVSPRSGTQRSVPPHPLLTSPMELSPNTDVPLAPSSTATVFSARVHIDESRRPNESHDSIATVPSQTQAVPSSANSTLNASSDPEKGTSDKESTNGSSSDVHDKESSVGNTPFFLVEFDGPNDPKNPRNWTRRRRWIVTVIVSLFTFIS